MGEAVRKIETTPSFADALKQTKVDKPKAKSKTTMPVLDAPKNIKEQVDKILEAKKAEKAAKGVIKLAGTEIIEWVQPHQDKDGYSGKYRKSYAIPGTNENQVKYLASNRFTINSDDEESIRESLGDKYDEMMEKETVITMKQEVFDDEEMQKVLMERMGDLFSDYFESAEKLKVKEDFDRMLYNAVKDKEVLKDLRILCKQYTPSLK